jgi:putative addiction module component (TIGR02574 family)
MTSAQDLLTQALELPISERAAIARQLLLSLDAEPDEDECESAWEKEIVARAQRLEQGQTETHDWREGHQAIRNKLRGDAS